MRAAATTKSKRLGVLRSGDAVTGTRSGWWFRLDDGRWVLYKYTCAGALLAAPAPAVAVVASPDASAAAPATATWMVQPVGTNGSPTSPFGNRRHPISKRWLFHSGLDLGSIQGADVVAAAPGVVVAVGRSSSAGINIKIAHGTIGGYTEVSTNYLHLKDSVVAKGQVVEAGQLIAHVGRTGAATKPPLHFTVLSGKTMLDPQWFIGPIASLRP